MLDIRIWIKQRFPKTSAGVWMKGYVFFIMKYRKLLNPLLKQCEEFINRNKNIVFKDQKILFVDKGNDLIIGLLENKIMR
jgi:hypothetical protein